MRAAAAAASEASQALDGLRASMPAAGRKRPRSSRPDGAGSVCKGGRALKACAETGEAADFHDLRKRVKYHWMHVRLVESAWPGPMRLRRREARQIGDLVGDEHNLSLLAALIREEPGCGRQRSRRELLMRLLADRQAALRAEALRRAGALFRDEPKRDAGRLALLWRQAS